MMEQEKTQEFRQLLEDWLEQLLSEADNTVSTMTDSRKDFADPTDRVTTLCIHCKTESEAREKRGNG